MSVEQSVLDKLQALPPEMQREVLDFIEFLSQRGGAQPQSTECRRKLLDFPVDHYGPWPAGISLRRESLYGNRGR